MYSLGQRINRFMGMIPSSGQELGDFLFLIGAAAFVLDQRAIESRQITDRGKAGHSQHVVNIHRREKIDPPETVFTGPTLKEHLSLPIGIGMGVIESDAGVPRRMLEPAQFIGGHDALGSEQGRGPLQRACRVKLPLCIF